MKDNQILKVYGRDYVSMTRFILEKSGLYEDIIKKGCRDKIIGLKPNLVNNSHPSNGATTHGEVIRGIIEYLLDKGDFDIRIYESSWIGDNTMEAFKTCGYDRICSEFDIPFYDTKEISGNKKDCDGMELSLCGCVDEIGYLINVPVLKGHCQTKITCALKNMKGLIPDSEKRRYHTMGLHDPIAHVNTGIKQDFIVVDHICGDLNFEDGGNPVERNCILTAKDPVLMDAYVARLLGYSTDDIPYIVIADRLGVGSSDLSRANVSVYDKKIDSIGDTKAGEFIPLTDSEICDEEIPDTSRILAVKDVVNEVESCSACYGYLIPVLDRIRTEGNLDRLKERLSGPICIGQGHRGKTGEVGIGSCTSGFSYSIKGCPPTESEIYNGLMEYIESI